MSSKLTSAEEKRFYQELAFKSDKDDWETPDDLFADLHKEFKFTRDVAASDRTAKCRRYWTKADDCLLKKWGGVCWMNPPYGRGIGAFIRKAAEEAAAGRATTVCLLPARTDTAWWHDYIWSTHAQKPLVGVEVRLLRGRLRFKGAPASAPFPSAIVIFHRSSR